jgi:hypothetical protein
MPLKVPIRTYRAAIQGQEANARASVALAPPSLPACSIEGQKGHGDEPAKPGDGGQWRAGVFLKQQTLPARRTPAAPGFRRGISHHGVPARKPVLFGGPRSGPFSYGALRESVYPS